ncbi:hypothetical protein [Parabacteroides provencensis]|uniref:hypothetical protein n=1 Tax=Parabacteroides provencensis TaxID=1944636 RepID=UPI000C144BFA|nr:hypothetical protein [Parabacteroides provencensis]
MQILDDSRNRIAFNDVGEVHIDYAIVQATGKPVTKVRGDIVVAKKTFGTITVERDGRLYISFDYANNITADIKKQVVNTVLTDADVVFNETIE